MQLLIQLAAFCLEHREARAYRRATEAFAKSIHPTTGLNPPNGVDYTPTNNIIIIVQIHGRIAVTGCELQLVSHV